MKIVHLDFFIIHIIIIDLEIILFFLTTTWQDITTLNTSAFRETATKKRFDCRGGRQHWETSVSSFELRYCWRLHWYSSVTHILVVAYIDQQSLHYKDCRLHFLTYVTLIIAVAYIEMKRRTLIYDYVEY